MSKKEYLVRAKCIQCAWGTVSQLSPEVLRERFFDEEKKIDTLCPLCATEHQARLHREEGFEVIAF